MKDKDDQVNGESTTKEDLKVEWGLSLISKESQHPEGEFQHHWGKGTLRYGLSLSLHNPQVQT